MHHRRICKQKNRAEIDDFSAHEKSFYGSEFSLKEPLGIAFSLVTVGSLSFSSVLVELAGLELRVDIVPNDLKAWNRKYSPFRWVVGEDISHY